MTAKATTRVGVSRLRFGSRAFTADTVHSLGMPATPGKARHEIVGCQQDARSLAVTIQGRCRRCTAGSAQAGLPESFGVRS
jgi:hypothetical protein